MNWTFPYPKSDMIDWAALETLSNWMLPMMRCDQNPTYHSEGDVWTHTKMICEAMLRSEEWLTLSDQERSILYVSGLLHDFGKPPLTKTVLKNNQPYITSEGHARRGAKMARILLQNWGVPFEERERIVNMILFHVVPALELNNKSIKFIQRLSYSVDIPLLYQLCCADILGRTPQNKNTSSSREHAEMFKLQAMECLCWGKQAPFLSDHSRVVYFENDHILEAPNHLANKRYDDTEFTVIMMSGLPGSGKSTWIKENCKGWDVVSMDATRASMKISPHKKKDQKKVATALKEAMRILVRKKQSFVLDSTNLNYFLRQNWIKFIRGYRGKVEIVYLEPPMKVIKSQNMDRPDYVPEEVVDKMFFDMEVPSPIECHKLTLIT